MRLMPSIYASATLTVAYIGESGENGGPVVELGTRIIEPSQILLLDYKIALDELEDLGLPPDGSAHWLALREFFKMPRFQRVWISQEFTLSPNLCILYGDWTVDGTFVCEVFEGIMNHSLGAFLLSAIDGEKDQLEAAMPMIRIGWLGKLRSNGEERSMVTLLEQRDPLLCIRSNGPGLCSSGLSSDSATSQSTLNVSGSVPDKARPQ